MKIIRSWAALLIVFPFHLLAQQDPDVERGFKPGQSYETAANIDVVNLFNGTLNLTIPLRDYVVGGTLRYGFAVRGATNPWDVGQHEVDIGTNEPLTYGYTYPWRHGQAGLGWILTLGKIAIVPDSGDLVYIGADGTQHRFYYTLHGSNPAEQPAAAIRYTRDGTYLRLKISSDRYELNFPNGHLHTFDTSGRLKQMQDPFGNYVGVLYSAQTASDPFPNSTLWTITDSVGRTHKVYFRPGPNYVEDDPETLVEHEIVHRADLAAFNGATAQYKFTYENASGGFSQVSRRCAHKNDPDMQVVNVALLTSVGLDGYLEYAFEYDKGNQSTCSHVLLEDGASGNVRKVILPTGGSIEWTFRKYHFPGTGSGQFGNAGVATRTVKNHDGAVLAQTTYVPETIPPNAYYYDVVRTVTEKDADFKTKHYFGACRAFTALSCQRAGYYGLPVTTSQALDGAYLSTEVWKKDDSQRLRATYRKYDADYYLDSGTQQAEMNQRLSFEKTVYEDNSSTSTTFTDFDGLGHYRSVMTTGSWGLQNSRTTLTNYNPDNGSYTVNASHQLITSFTLPATNVLWLLSTFDKERVTESSTGNAAQASESGVCFDSLGFLTSRRTYKNFGTAPAPLAADLLARFTRDNSGNLIREQYVGGDAGVVAPTTWTCGSTLSSETYRIDHQYQHGVRARSYYHDGTAPLSFFILDRDVDQNSGFVKGSRQASTTTSSGGSNADGVRTKYEFDLLGRLTNVLPQGTGRRAKTTFTYAMNPPSVTVSEIDGSNTLRTTTTNFDSLGRVRSESRSMPGGTATRSVEYDVLGRKTSERNWGASASTTFSYDLFGRPVAISAPTDPTTTPRGATTTIAYTGVSKTTRSVEVRTGAPGEATQYTTVTTTEEYDPLGRLRRVTEPPPSVGGTAPQTEYTYDVAGRLTNVCGNKVSGACGQTRAFSYDNRGFLLSETHPEKGVSGGGSTQYADYDARGHARRRYEGSAADPSFEVKFELDRAERIVRVFDDSTLKRFVFGTANSGTDLRNGRLTQAVGYNWVDSAGLVVKVVEDYKYDQADGLISSRTTSDIVCTISSGNCDTVSSGTKDREFVQSFAYDKLGLPTTMNYPDCTLEPCAAATDARTITNTYSAGLLTGVTWNGAANASTIEYAPHGAVSKVTHGNSVVDTQAFDAAGRLKSITTSNALAQSSCLAPSFSTQPQSQTITSGATATLTASATGEDGRTITYQWYRGSPPSTSTPEGSPTTSGTLQVTLSQTTTFWVRATNDCTPGTADSVGATITVCTAPSVTFSPASRTITRGQSTELLVIDTGSTPITYQWYTVAGGVATAIQGATSESLWVSPTTTTTYRVQIANACGNATSTDATVTVADPPTAPRYVEAVRTGTSSIRIGWWPSSSSVGIDHYRIVRLPDNRSFKHTEASYFYDDSFSLVVGNAYTYRVYAIDKNGVSSEPSPYDLATLLPLADDPAVAGQTIIRGIHIGQLREAIDAVRRAAGLAPAWQSYTPATGTVFASDLVTMRDRLNEARAVLQLPEVELSPAVSVGSMIRAIQLQQLRGGVQ